MHVPLLACSCWAVTLRSWNRWERWLTGGQEAWRRWWYKGSRPGAAQECSQDGRVQGGSNGTTGGLRGQRSLGWHGAKAPPKEMRMRDEIKAGVKAATHGGLHGQELLQPGVKRGLQAERLGQVTPE